MEKKVFYWIAGSLMALSLLLSLCGSFLNPQVPGGELTLWTLAVIFVFRPVFYLALGGISAVKLFPKTESTGWRMTALVSGILLTAALIFISAAELLGHPVQIAVLQLLRQVFRVPGYFLIPGMLLGFGLFES